MLFAKLGELPPSLIGRIAGDEGRHDAVVRTWQARGAGWGKALVFTATVAQAASLAARLLDAGARVAAVFGDTLEAERRRWIEAFRGGALDVLVHCGLLTESTDFAGVSTVLLARPTRSRALFQQMIGCAMRGPEAGGSLECQVVAFHDAITGLASDVLALTFATERDALGALGLEAETGGRVDG